MRRTDLSGIDAIYLSYPLAAHIALIVLLYVALTIVRAPGVWGIGLKDGKNPFSAIESRVSANLRNQFEWPVLFYAISILQMVESQTLLLQVWLAWIFVAGRLLHSAVQVFTQNIRLRGLVFTVNFVAVLLMWGIYLVRV